MQGLKFTLGSHVGCIYNPEHQKTLFHFKQNATSEHGRKAKEKWEREELPTKVRGLPRPIPA